jgi:predicted secreted protein
LFAVLPWGNAPQAQPQIGNAPGAPANPRLKLKIIATTILSAIIWLAIELLMKMDIIDFHEIASGMMREDGLQ